MEDAFKNASTIKSAIATTFFLQKLKCFNWLKMKFFSNELTSTNLLFASSLGQDF